MGQVYSAFLLLYTLAMTPTGWLIDRFGARAALMVLTFGSVFFVGATGVVGLSCSSDMSLWIGLLVVRADGYRQCAFAPGGGSNSLRKRPIRDRLPGQRPRNVCGLRRNCGDLLRIRYVDRAVRLAGCVPGLKRHHTGRRAHLDLGNSRFSGRATDCGGQPVRRSTGGRDMDRIAAAVSSVSR